MVIIDVENFKVENSTIGKLTIFTGPMSVVVESGVRIGFRNRFNCGKWVANKSNYKRLIKIEENVLITNGHHFDVAGEIVIGEKTVIAGVCSQFWTHGNSADDIDIDIGSHCYIGSSCIFCPGSGISDHTVTGAGAIISKRYEKANLVVTASRNIVRAR